MPCSKFLSVDLLICHKIEEFNLDICSYARGRKGANKIGRQKKKMKKVLPEYGSKYWGSLYIFWVMNKVSKKESGLGAQNPFN